MKDVKNKIDEIKSIYFGNLNNDQKYKEVVKLWNEFYSLCNKKNIYLDEVEDLRMMFENECYSINQEPKYVGFNKNEVNDSFSHLNEVLFNNKNGLVDGIYLDEANILLDYVVFKVREIFGRLGVDIKSNSLNGYCELGQSLSISFFDELGLKVTKNSVSDLMNYDINHCFGTVTFPIKNNDVVVAKTFLIDTTYRQFFTSIRCNEGMYLNNFSDVNRPDPGYFIRDQEFAKKLMRDGYILLDETTAKLYGEPFYLASLNKDNIVVVNNIDFYNNILDSCSDYKLDVEELEGLEIKFPSTGYSKGGI